MNYATPVSVYGMLPANAEFVDGGGMAVYRNGKKDAVISWDSGYRNGSLPVSYMYSGSVPDGVKASKKFHLINGPFDEEFFRYRGESGRHFREYRNGFRNRLGIRVAPECPYGKVLDLIKRWEAGHGKRRYRMVMHSSYDKRFFRSSLAELGDRVTVFYFMDGEKCVGYKVLDAEPSVREDGLLEFRSMLRKYDPAYSHLCLYVDLTSYEILWERWKRPFCVNVGCSSGGVAKYKREKFPVIEDPVPVYFYKIEPGDKTED